jgi:transposase
VSQSWEGNTSDTHIVQERAQALLTTFQTSPTPRYLVADAQLYNEDNAANLQALGCITRIPHTLKLVSQVLTPALRWDTGQPLEAGTRYQRVELCHDKRAQQWLVVWSQAARERAEATVTKAQQREAEAIDKQFLHLQAQRFETPQAATAVLAGLAQPWRYHQVDAYNLVEHKRYACKGRPTSTTPLKAVEWHILGLVQPDEGQLASLKQSQACFVLGTNIDASQLSDLEVMQAYKNQAQAEGGFRFLTDPLCFVSALFVKKPSRIQGLLTVMPCALRVYSVTQRRLRQH